MKTLITLVLLTFSLTTQAAYRGDSIGFSESEIREHEASLRTLMETASNCLESDLNTHNTFFRKWGISPYYGDQSSFAKSDTAGRRAILKGFGFDNARIDYLMKTLKPTSCIGLTLRCMEKGFLAAGQDNIWAKLKAFTKKYDQQGDALQAGLQELGWKLFYWNPDSSRSAAWDQNERQTLPNNPRHIWGYHYENYKNATTKGKYLYNKVDDARTLVDFGREVPRLVKEVPFFVGIAHMGYHVFPGSYGQVIEGHSTRKLNDSQTVETSPFNPLADGGGPRGNYYSGLLAIPPGYDR